MNEFLEANQKLNYAINNPERSALGEFLPFIVKHCAEKHPDKLQQLNEHIELLTTPNILTGKKNYEGVTEIALACSEEIKKSSLEATMKK